MLASARGRGSLVTVLSNDANAYSTAVCHRNVKPYSWAKAGNQLKRTTWIQHVPNTLNWANDPQLKVVLELLPQLSG